MNSWNFTGNLGKDAEIKTTQAGNQLLTFSVAVKSGYGDNEKTNWIHCSVFGKRAEGNLVSYLTKGQQVAISGEFELKEWQGQDGTQNKMPSVIVRELDLIGKKEQPSQQQGQGFQQPQQQGFQQAPQQGFQQQPQAPIQQAQGGIYGMDDDIPFIQFERGTFA